MLSRSLLLGRGHISDITCKQLRRVMMSTNEAVVNTNKESKQTKRARRKLKSKEVERKKREEKRKEKKSQAMTNDSDIIEYDHLQETSYYFQNGLRKVYPYNFTFSTFAKGRWYGRSLLDVFSSEFHYKTSEEIEKLIREGKIKVNGNQITSDYKISGNDYIANTVHRHEMPVTDEEIELIVNTADTLVINKPSSIPVHPCGRYRHNSLTYILAKQYAFTSLRTCFRLDRLTSGIMIFGKTEGRANMIIEQIRNRQVQKEYVSRVRGEFPSGIVECNEPIGILAKKLGLWKVSKDGKTAHTTFEKISYNGSTSVVRCKPHTGRTHQIRIHLQYLGFPVVNDPMYRGSIWGPHEGKGGEFGRPDEEVINDLIATHNVDQFIEGSASSESNIPEPVAIPNPNLDDKDIMIQESVLVTQEEISSDNNSEIQGCKSVKTHSGDTIDKHGLKRSHNETVKDTSAVEKSVNCSKLVKLETIKEDRSSEKTFLKSEIDIVNPELNLETNQDCDKIKDTSQMSLQSLNQEETVSETIFNVTANAEKTICTSEHSSNNMTENKHSEDVSKRELNLVTCDSKSDAGDIKLNTCDSKSVTCVSKLVTCDSSTVIGGSNSITCDSSLITPDECEVSPVTPEWVRSGYDASMMTVDEKCQECKVTFKDPSPSNLVMYLHAYRYKGPDWEYSTALPDWAREDWQDPHTAPPNTSN